MTNINSQFAKKVIDRIKNAYNMTSDTELADHLGIAPSTLSTWKKRNSLDYELIFSKCEDLRADYIIYGELRMFRDEHDPRNIKKPESKTTPQANEERANYNPDDLKQQAVQFVHMIENMPWPVETRKEILQSYLRIVDEELSSLPKSEKADPPADD